VISDEDTLYLFGSRLVREPFFSLEAGRMYELISAAGQLAWPLALVVSWMAGELAHRWTGLPRISVYGQIDHSPYLLLASLAFGLIRFELGYRINLRWLRAPRIISSAWPAPASSRA
jgi:hypothetical protein